MPNQWVLEPHPSIHVELDLVPADDDKSELINSIEINIPYPFLCASSEPALKLCFALAQHLGWRVFDEQIGVYINSSDIKDLAATQAKFGDTAKKVLTSQTRFEEWFDQWAHAAMHQSLVFLIITIALAALSAMVIVVLLDVQKDKIFTCLFWVGLPIGLAIFTMKITFDVWLERRRKIGNGRQITNR